MPATAPKTTLPIYQQLAGVLEEMIQSKSLRPGDRMPSVRQFGRQQGVSIPTAMSAYASLETRGLIEARPKSGFFVRLRESDLVRSPWAQSKVSKITDFANLDPLASIMADHSNPKFVPLGAALPSASLLPGLKLARLMGSIARRLPSAGLDYDVTPGCEMLRRELARRSLDWGCHLKAEDFIITNGGTEAVSLALRAVTEPGDTVIVETPTYFGFSNILRELRLKALPIPVDSVTGLDIDALRSALKTTRVAAAVLIPNFHNPMGCLMPDEHKKEVATLLAEQGIPIIEDDIYGDLRHSGSRPRCLKAFDPDGSVLLCSTFSKVLAPGYRVGYIAAGKYRERVLKLKDTSTMANATLPTLAVAEFVKHGGYDRHLRHLQHAFSHQVQRMREAIVQTFPENIGLSRPQGNFLLWCELPKQVDSLELFKRARAAGISVAPGPLFSSDGGYKNFIRINCGHPWTPTIERSIGILGHLVHQLAK
jgi:DNA-binding transcriptional MocR family regulator